MAGSGTKWVAGGVAGASLLMALVYVIHVSRKYSPAHDQHDTLQQLHDMLLAGPQALDETTDIHREAEDSNGATGDQQLVRIKAMGNVKQEENKGIGSNFAVSGNPRVNLNTELQQASEAGGDDSDANDLFNGVYHTLHKSWATDFRLPRHVTPTHYTLDLRPHFYSHNPDDFTLEGNVTITLQVTWPTDVIAVNFRSLHFRQVRVWDQNGGEYDVTATDRNEGTEIYRIVLERELPKGAKVFVFLSYTAPLKNDLEGVYYSRYYEHGQLQYMVASHFEPYHSRKAYPCLDEPEFKAVFVARLWRARDMVTLSNMDIRRTEDRGTWIVDEYEMTSVPMSTYLTAFAWMADSFTSLDTTAGAGLKEKRLRVWGTGTAKETGQLDYASGIAASMFDGLERLFATPFDLEKLDNLPVREYGAGAMENFGLVTYDDTRLLDHPNYTAPYDRQQIASTMAHEMVHMWFGNKVTCRWWEDVWLHETFARYYQNIGASNTDLNANWDHLTIAESVMKAYTMDDDGRAPPIHSRLSSLQDVGGALSSIIYDKGASMIRMLRKYVFPDDASFHSAQTNYLITNANGSAEYSDLIDAWSPYVSADLPVALDTLVETWILQSGHPVVTLSRDPGNPAQIHVSQRLFLLDDTRPLPEKYATEYENKWMIPFSWRVGQEGGDSGTVWLDRGNSTLDLPRSGHNDWILGNPGWYGFYRTNYDEQNWKLLANQLLNDHRVLDVRNRAQMLHDAIALSQSGLVSASLPVQLAAYLSKEDDYLPWAAAKDALAKLDTILLHTRYYDGFKSFVKNLVLALYGDLGWEDSGSEEAYETKYLRTLILELACKYGHEDCVSKAMEKFNVWVMEGERRTAAINPSHRQLIACTSLGAEGTSEGSSPEGSSPAAAWDGLYAVYAQVRDVHRVERIRVRNALACTTEPQLLQMYAELAASRSPELHPDDHSDVLITMATRPAGHSVVWAMLDDRWPDIPDNINVLDALTTSMTSLEQLEKFIANHPPSSETESEAYEASRYKVKANGRWQDRIQLESDFFTNLPF